MRLVTGSEMAQIDENAIYNFGISGLVLMENAGNRVVEVINQILGSVKGKSVLITAGKGNNGGDGFVIARHLYNRGADVQVFLASEQGQIRGDALINLNIWKNFGQKIFPLINDNDLRLLKLALMKTDLVVDALYGTGFKGLVKEPAASAIENINTCGKPVVSVDIPSGLEADTGKVNGPCIQADHTVTFAFAKIGLVLYPGYTYTGHLHVVDISIPPTSIKGKVVDRYYLTGPAVRNIWPRRYGPEHKGNFGHVFVIAGSRGMSGAAVLAAQAAARTGAGLVTLGVPAGIHNIAESKLTEVMTLPLSETAKGTINRAALNDILEYSKKCDVLAIGPGMGTNHETAALVQDIIMNIEKPSVLDADGLNAVAGSGKTDVLKLPRHGLIITPHPGEMSRLTGYNIDQIQNDRIGIASKKAADWNCTIVLKGVRTVVADNKGSLFINSTGNPGMASGGTGDVLTGVIAGAMALGLKPVQAAAAGVYLHGLAGDMAAEDKGLAGLLAGDLLEKLPQAIMQL